jgi:hypothetical protein
MRKKYITALVFGILIGCTIEAKIPQPVVTIQCLELVSGDTPVALDCAKLDAGKDATSD